MPCDLAIKLKDGTWVEATCECDITDKDAIAITAIEATIKAGKNSNHIVEIIAN